MGLIRRSCLGALLVPVVVAVLAVGLLGLAVDRGAHWVVGHAVEASLRDQGARSPDVSFSGFPFLTQLLHRRFSHVTVRAARFDRDGLVGDDLLADLHGVRPVGATAADIDHLTGRLTVPYSEVEQRAGQPAGSLSSKAGQVEIRRSVSLLGQQVTAVGTADVRVSGAAIVVTPTDVSVDGISSGALLGSVRSSLTLRYPLTGLPEGVTVTSVTPVAGGLLVRVTGSHARLSR